MSRNERIHLVAPCGIDCGTCELCLCKDNQQLLFYLVTRGIPQEKLPCTGCRDMKGNYPVIGEQCATYACVTEHVVDFCFDCGEFPCSRLNPSADMADVLPHNLKVFQLCTIQLNGVEAFIDMSTGIKHRYYKGKMKIGRGPQI